MPVTVTVSRGTPLWWPIAFLFTAVGLGLIVAGFTVIEPVNDVPNADFGNVILYIVAAALVIPAWAIAILSFLRKLVRGGAPAAVESVPDELPEPPGKEGADLVALLLGEGKPRRRAVAGTVLELAARNVIEIEEHGDKVVIRIKDRAAGSTESEQLVLEALRDRVGPEGEVVGPPFWPDRIGWWPAYVRDARKRAMQAGILTTRIPYVGLLLLFIFTAVGFSLVFFWRIPVFVGSILFANGFPHLLARASGYKISDAAEVGAEKWRAFGRYLRAQGSFENVGPAGVAIWGPNLAYGAVLGVARKASRPLTPGVEDEDVDDLVGHATTQVYEL